MLGGAASAEIGHLGTQSVHEIVVGHRRETVEADLARIQVDAGHRRLVDDGVVLVSYEVAKRVGDGGRFDQPGRQLVEQRLKRVVVVPVDDDDLGVGVGELLRGTDS